MDRAGTQRTPRWETFAHGADIGVRGTGSSLAEAFEQAALALTGVVTVPERVIADECLVIRCSAPSHELLLYEWLNTLIYEMDTRRVLFGRCDVVVHDDGSSLIAHAYGERVDVARHEPAVEVKGATLTELVVAQDETGAWCAQCVVDV